eukprot:XP_004919708.2 PREDICTED: uncharacterized protein C16orf45 homolog isoform X2 [Xenopus tropicalis]
MTPPPHYHVSPLGGDREAEAQSDIGPCGCGAADVIYLRVWQQQFNLLPSLQLPISCLPSRQRCPCPRPGTEPTYNNQPASCLPMEKERAPPKQYGSLESTKWNPTASATGEDVISMADSTTTIDDIEGELFKIERIREILVRRESELRYMLDDFQLCKEITCLKKELQALVSIPEKDKTREDHRKEEQLLQRINKLVETRDFMVDDVEFERLREREEDKEMEEFLQSKLSKSFLKKAERRSQWQLPPDKAPRHWSAGRV